MPTYSYPHNNVQALFSLAADGPDVKHVLESLRIFLSQLADDYIDLRPEVAELALDVRDSPESDVFGYLSKFLTTNRAKEPFVKVSYAKLNEMLTNPFLQIKVGYSGCNSIMVVLGKNAADDLEIFVKSGELSRAGLIPKPPGQGGQRSFASPTPPPPPLPAMPCDSKIQKYMPPPLPAPPVAAKLQKYLAR
ncbi:hypothetical protein [Methylomonas koyamae]|uniref:hypothetical protein n=1 Tax=Methylomonas koyamae TaxID=702114 RepID=UPI002873A144|nr:hypothetical protein [Methylomonas koyamae]WNB75207.1 hypothetical protein RI210_18255 [Methylomonas koyamae]